MMSENSLYETLEVSPRASAPVIKAAYRCLVQTHHPDKNPGNAAAVERLMRINQAYGVLSDPEKRSRYDLSCGFGAPFVERRGCGKTGRAQGDANAGKRAGSRAFAFRPLTEATRSN